MPVAFQQLFSLPPLVIGAGYLIGYVLLDWISFIQPFAPFGITPWNPPPGLSFVLVLLFGQRFIPLLFVAPLLADILVRQSPLPGSTELVAALVIGGGYAGGLLFLLRPRIKFNPALSSMRDLVLLIVVAAVCAAVVAVSYVTVLLLGGFLASDQFIPAALQFWVGDLIGIAVLSPFGLILLTRRRLMNFSPEAAMQLASVFIALALVIFYAEKHHFQLFYVLFLPVIWMAVRGGLESVVVGILITQLGLIVGVHTLPRSEIDVVAFQALMLVLTMTGLVAGSLVTEHRRTEMQLRLHQDALARVAQLGAMGELAAAVAHEINQPLMATGTYARMVVDTLRSEPPDHATALVTAGKAVTQIERAAEVIRRLRALIRLDQSGRAPSGVDRIVSETLELCRPELTRCNVTTQVFLEPGLPSVMVDRLQVEQVLLNLVRNSVEAIDTESNGGGRIIIKASRVTDGNHVELQVTDSGPGFAQQLDTAMPLLSSTKTEGLGFGLSLCRSIIEAHGGSFALGNGAAGAVVRFTLPVSESDKSTTSVSP
jgi:signal transduction histidine kinase